MLTIRPATRQDDEDVVGLVRDAGLPLRGLRDTRLRFVADDDGEVVGVAALEDHGAGVDRALLLRSVVTRPERRAEGIGAALTRAALERADAAGIPVALLTETADAYFPRFGFVRAERSELPVALEASEELQGACGSSARVMVRPVGGHEVLVAVDDGTSRAADDVPLLRPRMSAPRVPIADPARRDALRRRIRLIVALTIGYNIAEAIVAIAAGSVASSAALVAFGLDSVVEVLSAVAVAWQFSSPNPEGRERIALRVIAVSFFALAVYVLVDVLLAFTGLREPEHSPVGIALAAASLLVMPFLSIAERRAGHALGSASAVADSKQTLICSYLAAALLVGLLLNTLLGWGWADSVAALVVVVFAVREGLEAWHGESCAVPVSVLTGERVHEDEHHHHH